MQPRRGLPPRPSLPANPLLSNYPRNAVPQQQPVNVGAVVAQALTYSLANPYGQTSSYDSYTNANYHSYFTQMPRPMTTAEGYTLSSTYVPSAAGPSFAPQSPVGPPRPQRGRAPHLHSTDLTSRPFVQSSFPNPGDSRCTYDGCSFAGSKQTVEIHMMDRHLIFPPGWKKPTKSWDADPSLKGKPVPIPGTGLTLNTPEAVDAWLADRKRRWPTKNNIEDKKRKVREAAARGEINASELTSKGRKRVRFDGDSSEFGSRGRGKRPWGKGRESNHSSPDSGWRGRGSSGVTRPSTLLRNGSRAHEPLRGNPVSSLSNDSICESDSDMDPIRDAVSSKVCDPDLLGLNSSNGGLDEDSRQFKQSGTSVASYPDLSTVTSRPCRTRNPTPQPRGLPPNPFAPRSSLLRNLLLPEIRHTVSNLSQAIHFLVENNFLEDVELNPGDAESQRIKVLNSSTFANVSDGAVVTSVTQE